MAKNQLPPEAMPRHVGIIMDGNGRWAKSRGLSRMQGHKQGANAFGEVVRHADRIGLEYMSVYAFSTENWKRPKDEVDGIMSLLRSYLRDMNKYSGENIRLKIVGDVAPLEADLQRMIRTMEEKSAGNTGLHLNIALNYGGKDELVRAARHIVKQASLGKLTENEVDESLIAANLYTAGQPDIDLLIRTSGELRISNFMLWQCAYAEFVFTDVLWPDFGPKDLDSALLEFAGRARRMGGI